MCGGVEDDVKPLAIFGAGGHGREVACYARELGWDVAGFVDDACLDQQVDGLPVLGHLGALADPDAYAWLVAVGAAVSREAMHARLRAAGASTFATLVHPTAWVALSAVIGPGCVVAPLALVAHGARVGANVLINNHASIGHDSVVGDHGVLCPYATTNGSVTLGPAVFLGTAAIVAPGRTVGSHSRLAAGALAREDVGAGSLVVGNPGVAMPRYPHP